MISTEYDGEEEGDSDEDNIPEAPLPPIISKQEVLWKYYYMFYPKFSLII